MAPEVHYAGMMLLIPTINLYMWLKRDLRRL